MKFRKWIEEQQLTPAQQKALDPKNQTPEVQKAMKTVADKVAAAAQAGKTDLDDIATKTTLDLIKTGKVPPSAMSSLLPQNKQLPTT